MIKKLGLAVPLSLLIVACGGDEQEHQPLHSVMTVHATGAETQEVKSFSGIVKEKASISLGFKTAGQIEHIYVKEGDYVREGQLLAKLDSKDYQLGVDAAEAQYQQLKDEVERMRKLLETKSITGNDFEKAEAGLKQCEVNLKNNRNKVEYTSLYAPANGHIESVNFEKAEMVNAGTPVFSILTQGDMKVEVNVPLLIYQSRNEIESVSCTANGTEIPVKLLSITPKADASQLYKALLLMNGEPAGVSAGMSVGVRFNLNKGEESSDLTLPESAVFQQEGKECVWVVAADSTVQKTEVGIGGIDADGKWIITSGISTEDEIVRAGVHALINGEKVKVLPAQCKTNIGGLL